jgi:hypothetical protein
MLNGTKRGLAHELAHPAGLAELSRAELGELLAQIKALEGIVLARLLAGPEGNPRREVKPEPDRMLTPKEAAVILRRPVRWISRHKKALPFVVQMSERSYRCSERSIRLWLKQHQS